MKNIEGGGDCVFVLEVFLEGLLFLFFFIFSAFHLDKVLELMFL